MKTNKTKEKFIKALRKEKIMEINLILTNTGMFFFYTLLFRYRKGN